MLKKPSKQIHNNEITQGFHFIRRSASYLASDLKYFKKIFNHLHPNQILNILGEIEEVEYHIQITKKLLEQKYSEKQ